MSTYILTSMFPNGFDDITADVFNRLLTKRNKFAFVASEFEKAHDITDQYFRFFLNMFHEKNIYFKEEYVVDGRMTPQQAQSSVQEADVVWLSGGDTPKEYDDWHKYGLEQVIKNHKGVIIGMSAGSINLGKTAICTVSSGHEKQEVYDGLGCVDISVEPHFIKEASDEILELSRNYKIYGLCDNSMIVCAGDKKEFYGEVYQISNGSMEQISGKKILLIGGNGLVGNAIKNALQPDYRVAITAGHHDIKGGYKLEIEDTDFLLKILNSENPDIVISSITGDFQKQMEFHATLAEWLAGKDKKLLYISTANVFDGDLSRPWTEADSPVPGSDYGKFKKECEEMLQQKLPEQLIIFRLSGVWSPECPRIRQLIEYGNTGKAVPTCQGDQVNITLADQIGEYARYVLDHELQGIFHIGTTDTVDYYEFQKLVCNALGIKQPDFQIETMTEPVFQAVIPARKEIPQNLQLTIQQVLHTLAFKAGKDKIC